MHAYLKRGALTLAIAGVVIIGGGFASAGYGQGSTTADDTVDVSFTIVSYRAIELSGEAVYGFGAVRQGATVPLPGPDILYATTWSGDQIVASIDTPTLSGISLYLAASAPTEPNAEASACAPGGNGGSVVATATLNPTPTPIITGITNCGKAADVIYPTGSTLASPTYVPNTTPNPQTWVVAGTTFTLDTSLASVSPNVDYTVPVVKTVTFMIKAGL